MRSLPRIGILLLPMLALVALVFSPGTSGGFLLDDFHNIVTNERLHMERLDIASLRDAATAYQGGTYGRPLATVSLALDFLVGGKNAFAFKITNILVHLLNVALVFVLARRLATATFAPSTQDVARAGGFALAVAFLWAIHPLQVSTVLYVVQRMELLAATFVLLSAIAWCTGRMHQRSGRGGTAWLAGAAALAAVGLLAKESAVIAALLVLALELAVFRFGAADPVVARRLRVLFAVSVALGIVLLFAFVIPRYGSPEGFAGRDFSLGERLLTQLRVLPLHLGQMLLPIPARMTFYYDDLAISTGLFSPWTTAAGAALIAALVVGAWKVRERWPLVSLGILWFFFAHALTSGPVDLELVFEHRNYLPLFGIALALVDLVRRVPLTDGPRLKVLIGAIVLSLLAALCAIRAATWGNPLVLASELAAINPGSARASSDLATLYFSLAGNDPESPFFYFAEQEFERGSRLASASPLPENGLILMAASVGRTAKPEWWDRLIHKVKTQPVGTQQRVAVTGLMDQYVEGFPVDATRLAEATRALLDRRDWPGWMYANFADFLLREVGDEAQADAMYARAIDADPADVEFAADVVANLLAEGRARQLRAVEARLSAHGTLERVLAIAAQGG